MRPNPRGQALILFLVAPIGLLGLVAYSYEGNWPLAIMFGVVTSGAMALGVWLWRSESTLTAWEQDEDTADDFNRAAFSYVGEGLFQHLFLLYHLAVGTRVFLKETGAQIELDPVAAPMLRRICRRNVAMVVIGLVVGLAIVPTTPLSIGVPVYGIGLEDAKMRSLAFFLLALFTVVAPIHWGIAVGCLLAPQSFFNSVVGQRYQRLIGTFSPSRARIVCAILALLIPALWITLSVIFLHMAPMADRPVLREVAVVDVPLSNAS